MEHVLDYRSNKSARVLLTDLVYKESCIGLWAMLMGNRNYHEAIFAVEALCEATSRHYIRHFSILTRDRDVSLRLIMPILNTLIADMDLFDENMTSVEVDMKHDYHDQPFFTRVVLKHVDKTETSLPLGKLNDQLVAKFNLLPGN